MREAIKGEIDFLNRKLRGLSRKRRELNEERYGAVWECIWIGQIDSYERILEADERKLPDGR